jgi:hypothetical protein
MTLRRTRPDGGFYPSDMMAADIDLAELPGRLKSPVSFYRSGRVILSDDFDTQTFIQSTGAAPALAQIGAYSPGNYLQLVPAATTPFISAVEKYVPLIENPSDTGDKIGLEILLCPVSIASADFSRGYVQLINNAGVTRWTAGIMVNYSNGEFSLLTSTGYIVIMNFGTTLRQVVNQWLSVKFIVDTLTVFYNRLIINSREFDISAYQPQLSGGLTGQHYTIKLQAEDTTGGQRRVGFDCLFLTRGEP